jgi:hypothetical protein
VSGEVPHLPLAFATHGRCVRRVSITRTNVRSETSQERSFRSGEDNEPASRKPWRFYVFFDEVVECCYRWLSALHSLGISKEFRKLLAYTETMEPDRK